MDEKVLPPSKSADVSKKIRHELDITADSIRIDIDAVVRSAIENAKNQIAKRLEHFMEVNLTVSNYSPSKEPQKNHLGEFSPFGLEPNYDEYVQLEQMAKHQFNEIPKVKQEGDRIDVNEKFERPKQTARHRTRETTEQRYFSRPANMREEHKRAAVEFFGARDMEIKRRELVDRRTRQLMENLENMTTEQMRLGVGLEAQMRDLQHEVTQPATAQVVVDALKQVCDRMQQMTATLVHSKKRVQEGHDKVPEHVAKLQAVYGKITDTMKARRVADELFQGFAITPREHDDIQSSGTEHEAAEKLIQILLKASDGVYQSFLEALKCCEQENIYQLIECSGSDISNSDWDVLRENYMFLVENLQAKYSTFVDHLYEAGVVDKQDKQDIEAEPTSTRQNRKLLSILSRNTDKPFEKFLRALDKSGQPHIATRLRRSRLEQQGKGNRAKVAATRKPVEKKSGLKLPRANRPTLQSPTVTNKDDGGVRNEPKQKK